MAQNGLPDSGAPTGEKIQWLVGSVYELKEAIHNLPCVKKGTCSVAIAPAAACRSGLWGWLDKNWRVIVFLAALLFGGKNTVAIARTVLLPADAPPAVEQSK